MAGHYTDMVEVRRLTRRWGALGRAVKKVGNAISSVAKTVVKAVVHVVKKVVDIAKEVGDKIKQGICKGWEAVSGFIIDTGCKDGCMAVQAGIDIAAGALSIASGVLNGLSAAVKAAAKVFEWIGEKLKQMINIRKAGFSAEVDANFQSGMMGGSVSVHFDGTLFGITLNVDFTINFSNILKSAVDFFAKHVKDLVSKITRLLHLAGRDLVERDIEYFETGHFRFKKRDLIDSHDTVLFDSRVHSPEEGIELVKEQIRRRRLHKRHALEERREKQGPSDPSDPAANVGEHISMSQLPVMPALADNYDNGPSPGLEGGEDNDFRIWMKVGADYLYVSCGTLVGAFSRKGPPCRLTRKVWATIFMSVTEPKGMSFRAASGKLCLAVDAKSSVVLTPCVADLPNPVWSYNNKTGQLTASGAGVAVATDYNARITMDDIIMASSASDGKCMTATKKKKLRMSKCADEADGKGAMKVQNFQTRINAESINLGDLVTFHSAGQPVNLYITANPVSGLVNISKGDLTAQQDDPLAAFKVIPALDKANYHFTFESVKQPGYYLSVSPSDTDKLVMTNAPKNKGDASWLPTPGPARPDFASGCPGITFGFQSRSRKGYFIRLDNDGRKVFLGNKVDIELLTCFRPVPPTGAPSASNTMPDHDDLEDAEADRRVADSDLDEGAEDILADTNIFGDGR